MPGGVSGPQTGRMRRRHCVARGGGSTPPPCHYRLLPRRRPQSICGGADVASAIVVVSMAM